MKHPRLRDSKKLRTFESYPLNEVPAEVIQNIVKHIVYMLCIGRNDITGDDWGNIFADSIGGGASHLQSPVGIADVVQGKMAWSMKTVKNKNPHNLDASLRLISGRCSPDYSYGISDPHEDIQKTGRAVLNIWNERVNIAYDYYNPVRTSVLVRSEDLLSFCLYEEENHRYVANSYRWEENKNGNLIGIHIETGEHCFTWQPHGSQFTIHSKIPQNAKRFRVRKPPVIDMDKTLEQINYDDSWIEIL